MSNTYERQEAIAPAIEFSERTRGFSRGEEVEVADAVGFAQTLKREFQNPNREQDKREWEEDNEKRRAFGASKVRRVERSELTVEQFRSEIDSLLGETESAVEAYNANAGKPNLPLIEARENVKRLTEELNRARQVLAEEEQKGSIFDRFRSAITNVENWMRGLVVISVILLPDSLLLSASGTYRRKRGHQELKAEVRQHMRIACLSEYLPDSAGDDVDALFRRANETASKLDALKAHISDEAGQE